MPNAGVAPVPSPRPFSRRRHCPASTALRTLRHTLPVHLEPFTASPRAVSIGDAILDPPKVGSQTPGGVALESEVVDIFLDGADFEEEPELLSFATSGTLSAVRGKSADSRTASEEANDLAQRLAIEHAAKGSISLPVTIVEELMQSRASTSTATHSSAADARPETDKIEPPDVSPQPDPPPEAEESPPPESKGPPQDEWAQLSQEQTQSIGAGENEWAQLPQEKAQSTGIVARFMPDKGYGFITPDDGSEDVFVHINHCNGAESLREGDAVTFDNEWNDHRGKAQGSNCTVVTPDDVPAESGRPAR